MSSGELAQRLPGTGAKEGASWASVLVVTGLAAAGIFIVYAASFSSMVAIWSRSDTFAHGFFILPISLYLVWDGRASFRKFRPAPDARAIALVALLGVAWLAARLANVLVVEQYVAVASLIATCIAVLGPSLSRRVAFPLGFLLFTVPVGEALIPYLIDYTAAFAVWALRATGVPVIQQGNILTLPNSVWSVVEECSGLRYLIACIAIGLPFAYVTYRSWKRRAVFVALSVAVPIVANWVRAYLVILIGYKSDMTLAVGIDHLIYGWIFYALVMFLVLWGGSLFSDQKRRMAVTEPEPEPQSEWGGGGGTVPVPVPRSRFVLVAAGSVLCASLFTSWAAYANRELATEEDFEPIELPGSLPDYQQLEATRPRWRPSYQGADSVASSVYQGGSGSVLLHVAFYHRQRQDAEMVSSKNVIVRPDDRFWRQLHVTSAELAELSVNEHLIVSGDGQVLVWHWYWLDGHATRSGVWAKLLEGGRRLVGDRTPGANVVLATEVRGDEDAARERLRAFGDAVSDDLENALSEAAR